MTNTKKTKTDRYYEWLKMQHINAIMAKEQRDEFRKVLEEIPSM